MRGETTLFKQGKQPQKKCKNNRGRSGVLIAERNKAICNRYYFYTAFFPFRYDVVIKLIAADFYLAGYTVIEILTNNNAALQAIKKDKPTIKHLSKAYLHYNWDMADTQTKAAALAA